MNIGLRLREKGQGLIEYGLIIILIAIVVLMVLQAFGPDLGEIYSTILQRLEDLT